MKIICLLLCLALAQGHIFRRRQHPRTDSLNVESLDYVNQEQRERYDVPGNSRSMDNVMVRPAKWTVKKLHNPMREVLTEDQTMPQDWQNMRNQQSPRMYQETHEQYQVPQVYRSMMDSINVDQETRKQYHVPQAYRSEMDSINMDFYRPELDDSQPENTYTNQVLVGQKIDPLIHGRRQLKHSVQVPRDPTVDNSWENQMIMEYARPVYADETETMNTRMYQRKAEMEPWMNQPTYGDSSSWRGIQFAVNPRTSGIKMREAIENIYSAAQKTMKHLSRERKAIFHKILEETAEKVSEDAQLNATQLLNKHQYAVETHTVKTSDGYYLTLFRIPPRGDALVQRPVVFLMHGLLGSADDWLLMGPSKSLAYKLSDAGYEVWLGNARGNKYSRRHVSKNPAQSDFWQFSTDEIALYDLPAMIDYALKTSEQKKLYYVGYSQGTTAFFALAATRPEYNNKIIKMYAMSPMAYMSEVRSPLFRVIAPTSPFYELLQEQLGHGEFRPSKEVLHTVGSSMCMNEIGCKRVCSNINFVMAGVNFDNIDVETIPVIMAHLPAGASTRQIMQYAQAFASREFNRYDYGPQINQEVYGSIHPPRYDMSKVEAPVTLYYSEEDWLAHPRDVERLAKELPKAESYKVPNYSHMDFQFSRNVSQDVNDRLIDSIKQTTQQINV